MRDRAKTPKGVRRLTRSTRRIRTGLWTKIQAGMSGLSAEWIEREKQNRPFDYLQIFHDGFSDEVGYFIQAKEKQYVEVEQIGRQRFVGKVKGKKSLIKAIRMQLTEAHFMEGGQWRSVDGFYIKNEESGLYLPMRILNYIDN